MRKSKTRRRARGRKKEDEKIKNIAWWAWHECAWQHCWWADNCKQHCCPIVALIVVEVTTLAPSPLPLAHFYYCYAAVFQSHAMSVLDSTVLCVSLNRLPWLWLWHWATLLIAHFRAPSKWMSFSYDARSTNFVVLSIKCYCCFYSVYQHCRWELNVYWMCGSSNFLNVLLKSNLKLVLTIANNTCRCSTLVAYVQASKFVYQAVKCIKKNIEIVWRIIGS